MRRNLRPAVTVGTGSGDGGTLNAGTPNAGTPNAGTPSAGSTRGSFDVPAGNGPGGIPDIGGAVHDPLNPS